VQSVIEKCTVYIEADNPDEAMKRAETYLSTGIVEAQWSFLDCLDDTPVLAISCDIAGDCAPPAANQHDLKIEP
jgi:hypothetical protein